MDIRVCIFGHFDHRLMLQGFGQKRANNAISRRICISWSLNGILFQHQDGMHYSGDLPFVLVAPKFLFFIVGSLIVFSAALQPAALFPENNRSSVTPDLLEEYNILFIHHSCGSNWLATDNGNLRYELTEYGLSVHDATYGDTIGDDTDVHHWYPKFRDQYDLVKSFDAHTNIYYEDENEVNQIIMFKSCYPASDITGEGTEPGDPEDSSKTIWNYKAAYNALLGIFRANNDTLFIPVTAPPRNVLDGAYTEERAARAREFNNWLVEEWAPDYTNIAVFDFFDVLADPETNGLREEYSSGSNSHPTADGNQASTDEFMEFIDPAIDRWEDDLQNVTTTTSTSTTTSTTTSETDTHTTSPSSSSDTSESTETSSSVISSSSSDTASMSTDETDTTTESVSDTEDNRLISGTRSLLSWYWLSAFMILPMVFRRRRKS